MSVRAEKPLRLMLLPIWPPSAAPMVTPGMLRTALVSEVAPWLCINALLMTMTDCGTSIRSGPTRCSDGAAGGAKSSLGRDPVTVTVCMVAGAALGAAGLLSVGGCGGGSGLGGVAGCCGACCAKAAGATRKPTNAVFTGRRRFTIAPQSYPPARAGTGNCELVASE